jgi:single-strand DNA-binding protein
MQGDAQITVVGNLTGDPELRFTQSGSAVVNFTVATNPRRFDRNQNQWVDGDAAFYRCNAWRQHAENIAESFNKGDRVIVVGSMQQRSYEDREGNKRTTFEVAVDAVGGDTKFAVATVRKPQRDGQQQWSQQPQGQQPQGGHQQGPPPQQRQQDPWDQGPPQGYQQGQYASQGGGQQQGMDFPNEPPF